MFKPFNSYTVHQPFGRDWTVKQLEDNFFAYDIETPIDGDAMTIAINERLGK